ncbi:hypothetical protein [Pseudogracilibacillus sp. SO30301A]|uniref:hypothetical protein n=1 Tax=Pseudogracilibacillus sp. SO30301A TaxID=3098291 RepID=UPI00300E408D
MDINDHNIKKMIEKKIIRLLEAENESIISEHKITGTDSTIHIHQNYDICLLLYLYLLDKNDVPKKEIKELEDQINRLESIIVEFNKKLSNYQNELS